MLYNHILFCLCLDYCLHILEPLFVIKSELIKLIHLSDTYIQRYIQWLVIYINTVYRWLEYSITAQAVYKVITRKILRKVKRKEKCSKVAVSRRFEFFITVLNQTVYKFIMKKKRKPKCFSLQRREKKLLVKSIPGEDQWW